MKKLFLTLGLAAFLMTSCCDKQENKENCEQKECCKDKKEQCEKHHECDHHEMPGMPGMCPEMMAATDKVLEAVANWENLDEAQRAEIIGLAKALNEHKAAMKAECEQHKAECEQHKGECKHHEGCEKDKKDCGKCHENEMKGECQHQHEGCEHAEK